MEKLWKQGKTGKMDAKQRDETRQLSGDMAQESIIHPEIKMCSCLRVWAAAADGKTQNQLRATELWKDISLMSTHISCCSNSLSFQNACCSEGLCMKELDLKGAIDSSFTHLQ